MVGHELRIGSTLHDPTVGDRIYVVDVGKEVQSVGDEDLGSAFGVIQKYLLKHRPSDVGVESRQRVLKAFCQLPVENGRRGTHVEILNIGTAVNSLANADTLLLTTGQ